MTICAAPINDLSDISDEELDDVRHMMPDLDAVVGVHDLARIEPLPLLEFLALRRRIVFLLSTHSTDYHALERMSRLSTELECDAGMTWCVVQAIDDFFRDPSHL